MRKIAMVISLGVMLSASTAMAGMGSGGSGGTSDLSRMTGMDSHSGGVSGIHDEQRMAGRTVENQMISDAMNRNRKQDIMDEMNQTMQQIINGGMNPEQLEQMSRVKRGMPGNINDMSRTQKMRQLMDEIQFRTND